MGHRGSISRIEPYHVHVGVYINLYQGRSESRGGLTTNSRVLVKGSGKALRGHGLLESREAAWHHNSRSMLHVTST
jgi:hypothetical protein